MTVFLFFHNLQPAVPAPHKASLSLDVRSANWAEIHLFAKKGERLTELGAKVFAPHRFRELPAGHYEIHWSASGRTGVISVPLKESQRVVIR